MKPKFFPITGGSHPCFATPSISLQPGLRVNTLMFFKIYRQSLFQTILDLAFFDLDCYRAGFAEVNLDGLDVTESQA